MCWIVYGSNLASGEGPRVTAFPCADEEERMEARDRVGGDAGDAGSGGSAAGRVFGEMLTTVGLAVSPAAGVVAAGFRATAGFRAAAAFRADAGIRSAAGF